MNENDLVWLRHMLEYAQIGLAIVGKTTRQQLEYDVRDQLALSKVVELIGESAGKVTAETRATLPNVAWRDMIGMRNVLAHDYFNMQLDIVWGTVVNDFPVLIEKIQNILPPLEPLDSESLD